MSRLAVAPLVTARHHLHPAGAVTPSHIHAEAQFGVVLQGTMTIIDAAGWWLAPPGRGVWVPPGRAHEAQYSETSSMILLLLDPALGGGPLSTCRTLVVSDLARALALEIARLCAEDHAPAAGDGEALALCGRLLALDLARRPDGPPLFVPQGQDRRLRRVTEGLRGDPGCDWSVGQWAAWAGSSPRTLARLFVAETGLSFGRWRDHVRVVAAIDRLARGQSITQTALDLGYQSASAFTTMFGRRLGMPPGRFLRENAAEPVAVEGPVDPLGPRVTADQ